MNDQETALLAEIRDILREYLELYKERSAAGLSAQHRTFKIWLRVMLLTFPVLALYSLDHVQGGFPLTASGPFPLPNRMNESNYPMKQMKALVKSKAEPGLWLEDVPEPEIGINDVLIRVDRTGICGTDLHIYNWDAWAQKTIPVPMVVGHEFVGEIVEVGSNVADFHPGRHRQRRRPRRLRPLPQLPGRPAASLHGHQGRRRQSARRVRRISRAADDQCLASSTPDIDRDVAVDLRSRSATRCTRRCRFPCWAKTC